MQTNLLFRRAILFQLDAARPSSIPVETIAMGLKVGSFTFTPRDLDCALDYLSEKGLLEISRSRICASHRLVKLSANGADYLESGEY